MKRALEQVTEFHRAFGHTIALDNIAPQHGDARGLALARQRWIEEEITEIGEAFEARSLADLADGLVDLRYFILGNAVAFGLEPMSAAEVVVRNTLRGLPGVFLNAYISNPEDIAAQEAATILSEIVVRGIAGLYGIDLDAAFTYVHERGNMRKLGADGKPIINPETGKVMKPKDWAAPDLSKLGLEGAPVPGVPIVQAWLPIDDYARSGAWVVLLLREPPILSDKRAFVGRRHDGSSDWSWTGEYGYADWREDDVIGYRPLPSF